ncbi:AI-2E family transporter [Saccharopolyspora rosea]|uniref:AI-2E family transporter n=1 Tax=Saccharopolyspora rosea TaxID=524884 RepID=A0ABW3FR53_9PSEU|nr:AI-2E family transporter [Saccharopolyspora rosea]
MVDRSGAPDESAGERVGSVPRGLVVLLGTASAVVVAAGVRSAAWLIAPTFLALVIVIAVHPVPAWLSRRGCPRWLATLVLVVLLYAVLITFAAVVVVSVARLAAILPEYAQRAEALGVELSRVLATFGIGPDQLRAVASRINYGRLVGFLGTLLSDVASVGTNLVFVLALLLFLGIEASGAGRRLGVVAASHPRMAGALGEFARGTRSYLAVSTVFGLIVAALDTVALIVLGVPLPLLWGLLAFVTNYIPNVGFIVGLLPPVVLALLEGGWRLAVVVAVIYLVLNFVVQSLIQPRFVGHAVGLSVTVTLLSLVFWTWAVGPLGAVLAVPLTLLAKALLVDGDPRAAWADAFLVSDRVSAERARGR